MDTGATTRAKKRAISGTIALVGGVVLGLGGFTFTYANGDSYLSADPRACINCHLMNDVYDSWAKGPHRHVATCVECHLPQTGLAKWFDKGRSGFLHSKAFTLQDYEQPLRVHARGQRILRENCVHCHADVAHGVAAGVPQPGEAGDCIRCHRSIGHGGYR